MTEPHLPPSRQPAVSEVASLRQYRQRRRKMRRRRIWRTLRRWILIGALGWAGFAFFQLPFWRVEATSVVATEPDVRQWGEAVTDDQALIGRHLLTVNPLAIETELRRSPLVAQAEIRRWLFPARIEVQLVQRRPWARIQVTGQTPKPLIDDTGTVLPLRYPGQQLLPLTFRLPPPQNGRIDRNRVLLMHQLYDAHRSGAIPKTGIYDLTVTHNLTWQDHGVTTWLGEADDLSRKFAALERLLPLAKAQGDQLEYIDIRFVNHPALKVKGRPAK